MEGGEGGSGDSGGGYEGGQTDTSSATVYNGSERCQDCGDLMNPVAVMYSPSKHCRNCHKKKKKRHERNRMSRGR